MSTFLESYIQTALWASLDFQEGKEPEHMDKNYSADDLAQSTRAAMARDCALFEARIVDLRTDDVQSVEGGDRYAHDFWLTRNGHGVGFWDGDYPVDGERLTAICKEFGEVDLYVGDDGKIYQSGDEDFNPNAGA